LKARFLQWEGIPSIPSTDAIKQHNAKGEKVGYYIMYSVSLPGVPELSDLGIIRQNGPGKVEKYCRSYSDPGGKTLDRVVVAVGAEAIFSASRVVDYAYVKKLMWFLMEKGRQPTESRPGQLRPKRCETCYKSFSKFSLTAVSAECQICRRTMCAKGNVVKKMKVDVSETGAVKQCAIRFCLNCLMEANEQSVWAMALSGVETASETSSASGSASSGAFHVAIIDDRELGRQLIKRWLRTARAIPDCRACRVSSLELSDAST
jgi:hypothetical protein